MSVRRVFVQKRAGFNIEAQGLMADLKENLGLHMIEQLSVVHRYDVEGLSEEEFSQARDQILSEPMVDDAFDEGYPLPPQAKVFALEYLPGQYDQRSDYAAQCIALLIGRECAVRAAKLIVLQGPLDTEQVDKVKAYMINAIENREASLDKPATLKAEQAIPADVQVIKGFTSLSCQALDDMRQKGGMAMTLADLAHVQAYFRDDEKRDPTITEVRMIDTYWSDHCRHTTFLTTLDQVTFDKEGLAQAIEKSFLAYLEDRIELSRNNPPSLMDMALTGPRLLKARGILKGVDESEEINACSIETTIQVDGQDQQWLVMFKNETHNHPTEVEPFGGAGTCLGGAIRDPLSGRSYVYQAMRVTGSGDPTRPLSETLPGKLPQRKITQNAASGYSGYGNQIGLTSGQLVEIYHEGYVAKRMELGAVVGAAPKANVVREQPAPGDVILLLGGRTGRDGIGGATGSSREQTQDSLASLGAEVQKGNPVIERNIQRLFRDPAMSRLIKRCNDFGAGGVSVAIGELAPGLDIDLDKVPPKYEGMDGTELALSESQERMAVVLSPQDVPAFLEGAAKENLEATAVAVVTQEPRLTMHWRGNTIVSIARSFLDTNGTEQHASAHIVSPDPAEHPYRHSAEPSRAAWMEAISTLNTASQQGLIERFDASIGAATVLMPLGGARQKTPAQAMVAKIPVLEGETSACTVMTHGYDPFLSSWSPYHGAAAAVVESLARLVATGGDHEKAYLSFQEFFERLREDAVRWGKPTAALLGALEAQKNLGTASIGGKDSMSGSFQDIDVPPALVSFAIAVADSQGIRSPEFKQAGSRIFYLPARTDENIMPDWDYQKKLFAAIRDGLAKGELLSAHTVGLGGVAAAVTRMCFGNHLGAELDNLPDEALYEPRYGSFVVEAIPAWSHGTLDAWNMGSVTEDPSILVLREVMPLDSLLEANEKPLSKVFPIFGQGKDAPLPQVAAVEQSRKATAKVAKPRVFIPAFPGTNGEVDTQRAFARAGAVPQVLVMRNRSAQDVQESAIAYEQAIRSCQILALSGGSVAGDEPEGAAKFITAFLNYPRLQEAILDLIVNRDGLILGIGNGFQALVKLGLLPYGEFRNMRTHGPALTYNAIGRHISRIAQIRVASRLSPWYALSEIGQVRSVALSHASGRFTADQQEIDRLAASGQIAAQICDLAGNPTMDPRFNQSGTMAAIEALSSPDGRILGKMGHSERFAPGTLINIPGDKDERIFESGILYFR